MTLVHCGLLYPFCFPLFSHSFQQLSGNSSSATFFASTAWTYISSSTRWQQSSIEFYNKAIMLCQAAVAHHQGESSELILHFPIQLEICIKMRAMSLFMASPPLWGEKSVQIINIFRFTHLHKYRLYGDWWGEVSQREMLIKIRKSRSAFWLTQTYFICFTLRIKE